VHRRIVAVLLLVGIIAAGCSTGADSRDEAGPCEVKPGVVCRDQDLRYVSMVAADLTGADFTGTDFRGADLRDAIFTDAKLVGALFGGTNLSGASLKNADLSKANLFFTNFTDADMTGAIETDAYACNVTRPNGGLVEGDCPASNVAFPGAEGAKAPTGPPAIVSLGVSPPGRCLNDAAGQGIEVDYVTRNTTGVTFSVDGIRIDGASKKRGTKRLPFRCDGKPHTILMRAFGVIPPTVTSSFTTALQNTETQNLANG
jgi:hypothetical protein